MNESVSEARTAALRLLKFRPRSETELKRRLEEKGFAAPAVDTVVADLRRTGLVGDERFARYFAVAQASAKPVGRRFLLDQLRTKGIEPALAEEAVQAATGGKADLDRAREAAAKRAPTLKGLPYEAAQRRLFAYLSRRGFTSEIIWKVIRETVHSSTSSE